QASVSRSSQWAKASASVASSEVGVRSSAVAGVATSRQRGVRAVMMLHGPRRVADRCGRDDGGMRALVVDSVTHSSNYLRGRVKARSAAPRTRTEGAWGGDVDKKLSNSS